MKLLQIIKINKNLLPVKGHYFFVNAGLAFVSPFIPMIAKDLGFSTISVGWVYTITPIISLFVKPLVGIISDKFKLEKIIFIALIIANVSCLFSLQWIPPLLTDNKVELECDTLTTKICSEKLLDDCNRNKTIDSLQNAECELIPFSTYGINDKSASQEVLYYNESFKVKFHEDSRLEDGCIFIKLQTNESEQTTALNTFCKNGTSINKIQCDHDNLNDIINKQLIEESSIFSSYQYWLLLFLVITARSSMSCSNSLIDSMCFNILGEKPENYGLQRMWAGIGWGSTAIISGLLVDQMSDGDKNNYILSYYAMLGFYAIDFLIVSKIEIRITKKPLNILKNVVTVIQNPKICTFIIWCFLNGVYQAFISSFLFWFIEEIALGTECGGNSWIKTLEGLVLTCQSYAGEIPLMFSSGWILKKISHVHAMTLVLFAHGVRFTLYYTISDPWWILPIESIHGISYGLFYATMVTYSNLVSPPGTEATIQSLMSSIYEGAGSATGGLIGGYLFKHIGASLTFLILGVSAFVFGFLHIIILLISSFITKANTVNK